MKRITVLGATGSIGQTTCRILSQFPERFEVEALAAGRNVGKLVEAVRALRPRRVVIAEDACYAELKAALSNHPVEIAAGAEASCDVASIPVDMVVAGIMGGAGLPPTYAALQLGNHVALANKESLVMAGELMLRAAREQGVTIWPVDSEHSAIFQVLASNRVQDLQKVVLTASGGPFRGHTREQLAQVTPAQAVRHPNWSMGAKISVDSATLMNKGLELIEARHVFGLQPQSLDVLVHPESIVHGLAYYQDGSVLAQLSLPDMAVPIAYALGYPERLPLGVPMLDLATMQTLRFEAPQRELFPCLHLAEQAMRQGSAAEIVLNAANEVAVSSFLQGQIGFMAIAQTVEKMLQSVPTCTQTLEEILHLDYVTRRKTHELIQTCEA